jgi:hypothetical protein
MGAENDPLARRNVVEFIYETHTLHPEISDHVGIVYDLLSNIEWILKALQGDFYCIDGPHDAGAKTAWAG